MRRLSIALFCSFLIFISVPGASPVAAQEETLHVESSWIVSPEQPPTNNILFLIDGSGSMSGDKINVAIDFAMEIAGAPVDDLQIALVTFGNFVSRWEGMEDINPTTGDPISRPGWAVMPSAENLQAARNWLISNLDAGSTLICPGISHVFASSSGQEDPLGLYSQTVNDLTIIILTDGLFTDQMESSDGSGILATLARWQKIRAESGLNEAVIGVIGINVEGRGDENLRALAGNLGFLSLVFQDHE